MKLDLIFLRKNSPYLLLFAGIFVFVFAFLFASEKNRTEKSASANDNQLISEVKNIQGQEDEPDITEIPALIESGTPSPKPTKVIFTPTLYPSLTQTPTPTASPTPTVQLTPTIAITPTVTPIPITLSVTPSVTITPTP